MAQVFNQEALREYITAQNLAGSQGRRAYKHITLFDLQGLGFGHTDKKFIHLVRLMNKYFSSFYPETVHKIVVINAPTAFTVIYNVLKSFLHPITVSKVLVVGSNYLPTLEANRIKLSAEYLAGEVPSWTRDLARIRAEYPEEVLRRGYLMPEEEERVAQLMQEERLPPPD